MENIVSNISDENFLRKHIALIVDDKIKKFNGKINKFASLIHENSKKDVKIKVCYPNQEGTADTSNPIYTYTNIKSIVYDTKNSEFDENTDDMVTTAEETSSDNQTIVDASSFLNDLEINARSILNIDFQFKLWQILKSGKPDERIIYLKKACENENDAAGKYNICDKIFRKNEGCSVKFLINENDIEYPYPSYDDRFYEEKLIDVESPDFFSRFQISIGPLKRVKSMGGFLKILLPR